MTSNSVCHWFAGIAASSVFWGFAVGYLLALPVTGPAGVSSLLHGEAIVAVIILAICLVDVKCFSALPAIPPSTTAELGALSRSQ